MFLFVIIKLHHQGNLQKEELIWTLEFQKDIAYYGGQVAGGLWLEHLRAYKKQ